MADYVSTTNACKLCTPLGACVAFKGVEGGVPFLHGSQGCATYMRRYIISHFREPMDVASSALGEKDAIHGGGPNLIQGVKNVVKKYSPKVVGVATTCLTETIGDDVPHILRELKAGWNPEMALPELVRVSTPSYQGSHIEGFNRTVKALVEQLTLPAKESDPGTVNILPGFVSPEDIRHLRGIAEDFGLAPTILPDYSETLDAPSRDHYENLPSGGTPLEAIRDMARASATIELGRSLAGGEWAGAALAKLSGRSTVSLGLPVGLRESDAFFRALEEISGRPTPEKHALERGRLVDSYVDGHKYVFGKKIALYGEEDLVIGLASFLAEIGCVPVLCATGTKSPTFAKSVGAVTAELTPLPRVVSGVDFHEIENVLKELKPDLLVGNSKGYTMARRLNAPLLRVGFPIHDRFGGQRLLHVGYRGAQRLFDEVVNLILAAKQDSSNVGYAYL